MNSQVFSLQPFSATNRSANLQIAGTIHRQADLLDIQYLLSGEISQVAIAPPSDQPTRKHELWQETCFEFFVGPQGSDRYWEFNLSPSGDWNVYRFDNYRQGMQEETAITTLPFVVDRQPENLSLSLTLNLEAIALAEPSLEIAITTVIKHQNGGVTYWALAHTGSEADFHRRDSFLLHL